MPNRLITDYSRLDRLQVTGGRLPGYRFTIFATLQNTLKYKIQNTKYKNTLKYVLFGRFFIQNTLNSYVLFGRFFKYKIH